MWNLNSYIGHDAYIVAASAVVYNALGRLADDHAMQATFKQYVERPATLCIPLLLVTFSVGNGAHVYRNDFFDVPTDFWLGVYWCLLCGMLIYLLTYRRVKVNPDSVQVAPNEIPLVSEPQNVSRAVRKGRPTEHLPQLSSDDVVYTAGAPAMSDSVARMAKAAGARCYTDPFVADTTLSGEASLVTRFTGWLNQPRTPPIRLRPPPKQKLRKQPHAQ